MPPPPIFVSAESTSIESTVLLVLVSIYAHFYSETESFGLAFVRIYLLCIPVPIICRPYSLIYTSYAVLTFLILFQVLVLLYYCALRFVFKLLYHYVLTCSSVFTMNHDVVNTTNLDKKNERFQLRLKENKEINLFTPYTTLTTTTQHNTTPNAVHCYRTNTTTWCAADIPIKSRTITRGHRNHNRFWISSADHSIYPNLERDDQKPKPHSLIPRTELSTEYPNDWISMLQCNSYNIMPNMINADRNVVPDALQRNYDITWQLLCHPRNIYTRSLYLIKSDKNLIMQRANHTSSCAMQNNDYTATPDAERHYAYPSHIQQPTPIINDTHFSICNYIVNSTGSDTNIGITPIADKPTESLSKLTNIGFLDDNFEWDEDDLFIYFTEQNNSTPLSEQAMTMYKRVDKKVRPVGGTFPQEALVHRRFPHNPLDSLLYLTCKPPEFIPTGRLTKERMDTIDVNPNNLNLYQEILAFEDQHRGILKSSYFSDYIMATVEHYPWEFKNIPVPLGIRDKVIALLKSKVDAGVYEGSQSAYRCRWFCVLKKNGTLRMIHDLQPLNKVSIRDAGLLPIIDDFVEPFAARQCYSVFDLFWGYDARIVHPDSRDLTAFYTPLGLLRITCLPMGYTNSPAEFQKCMTFVLQDEIPDVANIFIDDLPIRGPATQYLDKTGHPETLSDNPNIRRFIWEHAQDVHRIMHRIKCVGATFSPKKIQLCRQEVLIVGIQCNPQGRLPDAERVAKILRWPTLTTPKEARRFLGLCGTVRIWIQDYSSLARPLAELFHKDKEFEWTEPREEAFNQLKQLVSTAPALRPIDYTSDSPIILSVDTSTIAIGFILSQIDDEGRRRIARYGSLPINERESVYSQAKLELYGLYRALRHWKIYIIGSKRLQVEMDAKYVKGMLTSADPHPNAAMNRWIQGILLFDFELIYVPANKFMGPDALSRRTPLPDEYIPEDDTWLDNIALLMLIPDLEKFKDFRFSTPTKLPYTQHELPSNKSGIMKQEELMAEIHHFLVTLEKPNRDSLQAMKRFLKKATQFYLREDRMFKKNGTQPPLLVIRDSKKKVAILTQAHEKLGHKGEQAVYDLVRNRFYWPYLRTDVHHHVASCHKCQIRNFKKMEAPLTISMPTSLFEKIYVDVMFMPQSGRFRYIVTAKDDLSGATEASALRNNNSESLASFFWEKIYCRYRAVGHVVTDNGPEVKGAFEILLKRIGIPQIRISPYNKRANGVVEREHRTLREAIVKSCEKDQEGRIKNWHKHIDLAVFAERVTVSKVTGYSPYQLLHGQLPLLPFDLLESTFMVDGFEAGLDTDSLLALRIRQLQKLEEDVEQASLTLKKARLRSKQQFNQRIY